MKRKVLFLCTKNSARSQMAEAILIHRGSANFIAYSAGSNPAQAIHPFALEVLGNAGFDMSEKNPKPMDEYIGEDFDFIITLCDKMKEECPVFPGKPILGHWGMPDPVEYEGTEEERIRYFEQTMNDIAERINLFLSLPIEKLDRLALELKPNFCTKSLRRFSGAASRTPTSGGPWVLLN